MTVPRSKRAPSEMEFIKNAEELWLYTMRKCKRYNKSDRFFLALPTVQTAEYVLKCVCSANFEPKTRGDAIKRRNYFLDADGALRHLILLIKAGYDQPNVDGDVMRYWMDLVDKEIRLIRGIMKSDLNRYRDL